MKLAPTRPSFVLLAMFTVVLGFLAATYNYRGITDTELNSYQTRALVLHGDVDIDRYPRVNRPAYFKIQRDDHVFSIYGVGISIVAAPMYAAFVHLGASERFLQAAGAIPFVAAAITLMYVLLSRLFERGLAVAGTIVFGFGTTLWPVAAMALYQHGSVAMFQVIGLLSLFSKKPRAPAAAGFAFAAAAFIRPTTAIAFGLLGVFHLLKGKRAAALFVAGSAVPIAGIVIQNRWIWGRWLEGGYSRSGIAFDADVPSALFGLSFGWWRGIFVYSPVFLLAVVGAVMAFRRLRHEPDRSLVVLVVTTITTLLFYSRWNTWWNGLNQFGYRYLLDVVPFLVLLSVYAVSRSRPALAIARPLALISILTMTIGAARHRFAFDVVVFADTLEESSLGQAWINFLHHPAQGIVRLAGVAAVAIVLARLAARLPTDERPLFDAESGQRSTTGTLEIATSS